MAILNLDRIRSSLVDKRANLLAWLGSADKLEFQTQIGPASRTDVDAHLALLDEAIEKADAGTLGQCTVCDSVVDAELLEMDFTACICLSHLPVEEMRQLERELELAQVVQRSLLPEILPSIPGYDLAAYSQPAQIVGGDYFDFFQFADGSHGLAIADVAGHGVSSSLHMASVQTALRTLVPLSDSPLEVLQRLNRLYNHNINFNTFVTLFLGKLESDGTLHYSSAGHNPPLLYHPNQVGDQEPCWLDPTGAAIGLVEDIRIQSKKASLEPGDILILYTDGVTEAMNANREQFGPDGLASFIRRSAGLSANELVQALRRDLHIFSGGQPRVDDTTILVCKILV